MNVQAIFEQFPALESDDLVLKKIKALHLDDVYEIYSNDHVFEYCGIIPKHHKDAVKNMIGHFERDYLKRSRVKGVDWLLFSGSTMGQRYCNRSGKQRQPNSSRSDASK